MVTGYAFHAVPAQSFSFHAVPAQSYTFQSFPAQSFTFQSVPAQGFGTDLGSLLLSRLLGGGLSPGTTPGSSSSDLAANTAALQANTTALNALTTAVKNNTSSSSDGSASDGTGLFGQLLPRAGVNTQAFHAQAQAVQAAQLAYVQAMAEAMAPKKSAPTTTADILANARKRIKDANDAVLAAQLFINAADARTASDTAEVKFLNDQLKKIGVPQKTP
jgi:hypothetical protein